MGVWQAIIGRGIEEPVLGDLVDCMYGSLHAVILSIAVYVGYFLICLKYSGDEPLLALIAGGIIVGIVRCIVAMAYVRSRRGGALSRTQLERSQVLYAVAGIAYAVSFGLVAARAAFVENGYVYGLAVVLACSYAQGLLIYVSVRPAIAMAQALAPMIICLPAALFAAEPVYQATAPMFLVSMLVCIKACRQQSGVFLELFRSRHVLAREAGTDSLTGLANRRGLDNEIERTGAGEMVAAIYLDLDRFKAINDALGHGAGDELLCAVANRLRSVVDVSDILARMGGDEFVVILRGERSFHARSVAEAILAAIDGRYGIDGTSVDLAVSIGISSGAAGLRRIADLVRDADCAMYAAKRSGRGRIEETNGLTQFSTVAVSAA